MTVKHATRSSEVVAAYAAAKSRADAEEAVRHCTDDFVVDTVAFGISIEGREANRASFEAFFGVFPDYGAALEGTAGDGEELASWGTIRATMRGPFGSIAPTGRRFELPYACVWRVRDGLLAYEQFFFDLHQMCEQLGLEAPAVLAEIHGARS
ncbi:MAG TPA: nuclear transport factor 2 family protein [Thermoleophilaceae bacterium]|nr:nuclear transport factor 2 family protein [Thermoleophilaceae bacterium]